MTILDFPAIQHAIWRDAEVARERRVRFYHSQGYALPVLEIGDMPARNADGTVSDWSALTHKPPAPPVPLRPIDLPQPEPTR